MHKLRKASAIGLLLVFLAQVVSAGNLDVRKYVLFGGSDTDSLEQQSIVIPVRGAQRVILRTWSTHLAFGGNADSAKADSFQAFKVAFSDSVTGFETGPNGQSYPVAADSVVITTTALSTVDTTSKMVAVIHPPLQEALRAPGNGSGIMTWVVPTTPGLVTADNNGFIAPQYMWVLVTPLRRNTANGTTSTQGLRVNGLRGLRMEALVIHGNK